MMAVQTCSDEAPSNRNSAASCQVAMPPMPEMGMPMPGCLATAETMLRAMGFTAGPQ